MFKTIYYCIAGSFWETAWETACQPIPGRFARTRYDATIDVVIRVAIGSGRLGPGARGAS